MRRAQHKIISKNRHFHLSTYLIPSPFLSLYVSLFFTFNLALYLSLAYQPKSCLKNHCLNTDRQKTFPTEIDLWSKRNNCSIVHIEHCVTRLPGQRFFILLIFVIGMPISVALISYATIPDSWKWCKTMISVLSCGHHVMLSFDVSNRTCIIKFLSRASIEQTIIFAFVVVHKEILFLCRRNNKFQQAIFLLNLHFAEFTIKFRRWKSLLSISHLFLLLSFFAPSLCEQ